MALALIEILKFHTLLHGNSIITHHWVIPIRCHERLP